MKKPVLFFSLTLICLCLTTIFAQSRKIVPNTENVKKANQRPAATPTPVSSPISPDNNPISQNPPGTDEKVEIDDSDVIKVETKIVSVPVKVLDRSGRFVGGLTKENFKVMEDNVEQQIEYFSNEEQPFTVALVLDMSFSAKFKAEEIQAAALAFIKQLRPNDKVMVVSFDAEVYVQCEPTSDRNLIQSAIRQTKISYGTSLYEAMDLVMNKKLKKIEGRKAIVLFSDGVDTSSRRADNFGNLSDALELDSLIYPIEYDTYNEVQAMKNKPVIQNPTIPSPIPSQDKRFPFPIGGAGGVGTMDSKGTTAEEYQKADEYLNELADRTGGRLYKAGTLANLSDAFSRIASELRQFYSIGYYPKDEANAGKKHKIKVRVDREGLIVKTRDSYILGQTVKKK